LDQAKHWSLSLSFYCFFPILKATSGKMCSSSSVIQAQKLVDQLRMEASMERVKVCKALNTNAY